MHSTNIWWVEPTEGTPPSLSNIPFFQTEVFLGFFFLNCVMLLLVVFYKTVNCSSVAIGSKDVRHTSFLVLPATDTCLPYKATFLCIGLLEEFSFFSGCCRQTHLWESTLSSVSSV